MRHTPSGIRAAYAACRRIARTHDENFPVASYLVPRDTRDALAAIYAFARTADDFADEPSAGMARRARLEKLADWRLRLRACPVGEHLQGAPITGQSASSQRIALASLPGRLLTDREAVFMALGDTIQKFRLSLEHFENLLRAFEFDVATSRHPNFSSLLAYCSCSANSVGRLVLELFGKRDPKLFVLSDDLCTGLQLANFWQDLTIDVSRGRIYLPLEDLARFGYSLEELRNGIVDERWRRLLRFEVERTREFFQRSRALPELVAQGLRRQLRLTWLGGMTILAKIQATGYDVFRRRPKLRRWDFLRLYLRTRRPLTAARRNAGDPAPAVVSRS